MEFGKVFISLLTILFMGGTKSVSEKFGVDSNVDDGSSPDETTEMRLSRLLKAACEETQSEVWRRLMRQLNSKN